MTTILAKQAASYTSMQKLLHWAVVVLLITNEFIFYGMGRLFKAYRDGTGGAYTTTSIVHIAVGLLVLLCAIWRLSLRVSHGAPPTPADEPAFFSLVAKATHGLLYLLLFAIPLLGLLAWFGKFHQLGDFHGLLADALLLIAGLHIFGALAHQFIWKDNLIARMT